MDSAWTVRGDNRSGLGGGGRALIRMCERCTYALLMIHGLMLLIKLNVPLIISLPLSLPPPVIRHIKMIHNALNAGISPRVVIPNGSIMLAFTCF